MARKQPVAALTFHGAAGTVTGSKYLLEANGARILIDCGMFQGVRDLRERNWQPWPFEPASIDAVLLTHAHLDHSGMLPVLYRDGFRGPVYCTASTAALASILLPDSGRIHEEDARHANRHGWSRHHPAHPLYTEADANDCLALLSPFEFDSELAPAPGVTVRFRRAGHILGAAWLQVQCAGKRLTFSGDVGRPNDPIMNPPEPLEPTDCLVVESTYGGRRHDHTPPEQLLHRVVSRTAHRHGVLLIPAFAVGRAQVILYLLWRLRESGAIGDIPTFLDSPMAIDATELFRNRPQDHRLSPEDAQAMCGAVRYINSSDESRALNQLHGPLIIVSASGMLTGGRILHHLRVRAGDPRNTILLTGYQAHGTLGAEVAHGADRLKIHGQYYPVRAEVTALHSLSAHADGDELCDWMAPLANQPPAQTFVTHGEPPGSHALAKRLREGLQWNVHIPTLGEQCTLDTFSSTPRRTGTRAHKS
jgi:metallo-beta-lactamase family protein